MGKKLSLKNCNPDVIREANVSDRDVLGFMNAWIPITACKADPEVPGGAARMIVEGFASTDHKDFEGETTLQEGLKWEYHLKHGWITDGHEKIEKATAGLGHPLKVEQVTTPDGHKGTRYRGFLLDTESNRRLYASIAAATELDDSRYGFSIQGPVLRRSGPDNKTLAQVLITDVALTRHPVNPYATLSAVAKSLDAVNNGHGWSAPAVRALLGRSAVTDLLDFVEKALDAGHPTPSVDGRSTGAALVRQSLDGGSMRKVKKSDLTKVFGPLTDDELAKAAKDINVEIEDEDEKDPGEGADDDGSDDDTEETKKALDDALGEIRAHLEAGGKVILDDGAVDADSSGIMREFVEASKALQDGDEATAKGMMAMLQHLKAQSDEVTALRASMDNVQKALEEISAQPVQPRAVRNAAAIPTGRENVPAGEYVPIDVARKSLQAALIAEQGKGADTSRERVQKLARALTGVEARTVRVTAKDLEGLGITI